MPDAALPEPESGKSPSPAENERWQALEGRISKLEERLQALEHSAARTGAMGEPEEPQPAEVGVPVDLERRVAGPFLNYVGLLALLLGLAFLIGYWMESHSLRALLVSLLSAAGLAALGFLVRGRGSQTLALTLEGSSLGLVYMACYLSYIWAGLPFSLLAGTAITLFAMHRAIRRDSQLVASIALLAALLGALLLRSARSGEGLLFGYLAVVNAGAVWTGRRKGWIRLRFLALVGSHVAAWFWYLNHPGANLVLTIAFPALTFLLFASIVPAAEMNASEGLLGVLNSAGLLAASFSLLHSHFPAWVPWAPLLLSLLHAGFGILCWRSSGLRHYGSLHGWIAGCLFAVGVYFPLPLPETALGWTMEALALGWLGTRYNRVFWRSAANLLGLLAAVAMLYSLHPSEAARVPAEAVLGTILLAGAVLLLHRWQKRTEPGEWEWAGRWLLAAAALALPMLALGGTIAAASAGRFAWAPPLVISGFWAAYSAALCIIGWLVFSPFLRWMGVGLLLMTAVKVFLIDPVALAPVSRIISFLLLAVFLLVISYLFQTRKR